MEEMDDFGDLYADLEYPVGAGASAIPGLQISTATGEGTKSDSKPMDERLPVSNGEGAAVLEPVDGERIPAISCSSESDSESDDDLHIVLNEEDCAKLPASSCGVGFGKGGMVVGGSDEEEEGDNLVIVSGIDRQSKDVKLANQLPAVADRFEQGGGERHMGSQLFGHSSSGRTSSSRKGDWELLMLHGFGGSTSCNVGISAAAQNGFGFSLPRNRTIFDVNIEAFEQKPWRHHGVDMTDYFNFGLDEDSWKSYCNRLEHCRQQSMVSARSQFYGFLRSCNEGKKSSLLEYVEKGAGSDMPKGRAIQVEGGLGERIPSTDMRRPRQQDSDVVIQITMENTSISCKKSLEPVEQGHIDSSLLNSQNKLNERVLLHHDNETCGTITNSVYHEKDPLKQDVCSLEARSASDDQVPHSSSDGLESRSSTLKDAVSLEKDTRSIKNATSRSNGRLQESIGSDYNDSSDGAEKVFSPIKKILSRSKGRRQESIGSDFSSDGAETEQEDEKVTNHDCRYFSREDKHVSRKSLQSVAKTSGTEDDVQTSNLACRKQQNDANSCDASGKTREDKFICGTDAGGCMSYRETEIVNFKGRMQAAKRGGEKSSTKRSDRNPDHVKRAKRNLIEQDSLKEIEGCFSERNGNERGRRSSNHEDSDLSSSERVSYVPEKDLYLSLANEKDDDSQIRMEAEYGGSISGHSDVDKFAHKMQLRFLPHCDVEEGFDQKYARHVSLTARELKSRKGNKYDRGSYFNIRSGKFTDNSSNRWRYLDHRPMVSHTYRVSSSTDERDWHDVGSLQIRSPISGRGNERFNIHERRLNMREWSLKKEHGIVRSSKNCHNLSYENDIDLGIDEYMSDGRGVYLGSIASISSERRHNGSTAQNFHIDNGVSFKHQEQNGPSSPENSFVWERRLRREHSHVKKHSIYDRMYSRGVQFKYNKQNTSVQQSFDNDAKDHVDFVTNIFNMDLHELEDIGCREALDMHFNGWKGKLSRSSIRIGGRSERQSATGYETIVDRKDSRHINQVDKEGVHLRSLQGEGRHCLSASLKVDGGKNSKPLHLDEHIKSSCVKQQVSSFDEDDEIEEGQLIEEPDESYVASSTKDWSSGKHVQNNCVVKDSSCNDKIVGRYDNSRILETLAKMEKRKERFKEPIAPKQGPQKSSNPKFEVSIVVDEVKQQRPARKRRWGGN